MARVIEFPIYKKKAATALTVTAGGSSEVTTAPALILTATEEEIRALARQHAHEEIVADLADHVINYWPVTVGRGPYDLDPALLDPCAICGTELGPSFAFGCWHRMSAKWQVMHARCVRLAEEGVL